MKQTVKLATVALASGVLLVTGCGLPNITKTTAPVSTAMNGAEVNLYMVDQSNGMVVPIATKAPTTGSPASGALDELVQGGSGDALATGTGLSTVLPKGTKNTIDIKDGLATVNFSAEALSYKTAQEEQQMVQSVVWTLTEFSTIKNVQLEFGGKILPTLKFGTPVGAPLSRESGINLQITHGAVPSDSSHVVVYVSDTTSSGKTYLVPVTRVIPKVDDNELLKAAFTQMTSAEGGKGVAPMIDSNVFSSTTVKNGVTQIDLKDNVFPKDASVETKEDILKSIWMSVSQTLKVNQIQLTVSGKPVSIYTGDIDWSKPVSNLAFVNLSV